ncbi:MAG: ABC transporter permease subunit [Clostridiales bacterium]|nr:ABC transporter permease subunit [Clostridiales bacterium]
MRAMLRRELRAYFLTPLGYVIIAVMYFFTAYYFFTYNVYGNTTDTSTLFAMLFSVAMFLVPVLTMRLLSEERRAKTEQTLLTAPISRLGIVLSKYAAALLIYLLSISGTLVMAAVLEVYSQPDWPMVIGNFIGLFLLGAALIAICLLISAFTESQVMAAVGGFGVSLFLTLMDALTYVVQSPLLRVFFVQISFNDRYHGFTLGIVDAASVCFFLSISGLFLALTVVALERRRWS